MTTFKATQPRHFRRIRTSKGPTSPHEAMLLEMRRFTAQVAQDPALAKEMLIAAGIAVEQDHGELSLHPDFLPKKAKKGLVLRVDGPAPL